MRKSIAPLMAIGVGAAWYSLNDRKTKRRIRQFIEPVMQANLMNARTWKKARKRFKHMFA
ncbi:hypothetical protein [Shouchella clausii]|uniref:hypothetical protein n=1 Tax=Shouchella clausii TaxID=79880 RepID=UPI000BA549E3|nr:hypothetical protein [Shouchella clausii]MEB5479155.1 DUF3918 domain-containing protein [Shouchella clausii]PAD12800.1 hypothetical protein CHH74_13865 [Shouchella clausii]PAE97115.1 hypothetical protein CHH71_10955 [Shouchella clausii]